MTSASPCATRDAAQDGRCAVEKHRTQPVVTEYQADGVAVMHIVIAEAGTPSPQRSHAYEHLTLLTAGSVRVWRADGEAVEYAAPAGIIIPAGIKHLFETLTPNVTFCCVHKTARTGRVEVTEEFQIAGVS